LSSGELRNNLEMKTRNKRRLSPAVQKGNVKWGSGIFLVIAHIAAVVAIFFWSWPAIICGAILYWVAGSLGIGMGFHRLITHRGYKVPKPIEYFLVLCGTLALEGGPIQWTTTHRIHHAHTDQQGDPHTPRDGRWWSHIGWIIFGKAQDYDEATLKHYAPDLLSQPFYVLLNRFYWMPLIVVGIGLWVFGGFGVMLWGVFLRLIIGLHATWLVNSATHLWGRRRFETGEDSRNSWWVAILTFGEGWHNNHHAHPTSARHGLKWYEIDFNWWGIRVLQFIGLARAIKRAHFDPTTAMWRLVRGDRKRNRSLGNAQALFE
jgi:stearoyl-CoA desaturase (delta-9 desaturase)